MDQDFWLAQANGTGLQEIPLASEPGDYRLVVMNATASRGLIVDVYGSMTLPFLLPLGVAMLVMGLLLLALAVGLLVWGIRSRPTPARACGRAAAVWLPPATGPVSAEQWPLRAAGAVPRNHPRRSSRPRPASSADEWFVGSHA